jgi:hypothetical protein
VIKDQKCDGCYTATGSVLDSDRTCTVIPELIPKDVPSGFNSIGGSAGYVL